LKLKKTITLLALATITALALAYQTLPIKHRVEITYIYVAPNKTEALAEDFQGHQITLTIEGGYLTNLCGKTVNAFKQEDVIKPKLTNTGEKTISLPNTAPWAIYSVKCVQGILTRAKLVYQPIAAQVIVKLKPNQRLTWAISLRELSKQVQIKPGAYEIAFKTIELGELSLHIAIKDQS